MMNNDNSFDAKIVVLGNSGVGKTSLLYRYVHGSYSTDQPNTIGAAFMTKRIFIDDWKVKFQIWDTAGQERFRSMTPMYYRAAAAAILVYDITSPESFEAVKEWVTELKTNVTDDIVIAIAGHKVDLEHSRRVSKNQATEFAKSCSAAVISETSALNNNGIEELFESMARCLIEKQKKQEKVVKKEPTLNPYQDRSNKSSCC